MNAGRLTAFAAATIVMALASGAEAQECATDKAAADLTGADVQALYDCIKDALAEGYASGDNEVAKVYRGWRSAATRPTAPEPQHGDRFLMTFVNDVGYDEYVKFAEEGVSMPEGTLIAKESFKLGDGGKLQKGPLFIMAKMAEGSVPETADWVYSGVQPNGKPLQFKQSFCHDCHIGFEDQDALGYPAPEVRVGG